jgi:hypothetical protein
MEIGRTHFHFFEKDVRHTMVIVLAGVDQHLSKLADQGARNRRRLDELGAGAYNGQNGLL